ncbi:MAG: formylglycine-generating enzyme family protein [Anaerolineae bacterium]|nr:formylglycine-generating enzyme family protein [Anaerolineae bacterium]
MSILDSWWREPALLVAGYLSVNAPDSAQKYLLRLAGADEPAEQGRPILPADVQLAAAEVAGTAALEWPAVPQPLKNRLAQRLADLFETPDLLNQVKPGYRATIGNMLARLGDPRPGIVDLDTMLFCYVPPGPFMMGEDDDLHQNDSLHYGYWLARYPVTVAQFTTFVEEAGFQVSDPDSLRGLANHPVVNVTWRKALAFCTWLTGQWQQQGYLPGGWRVTLPSEAEWEKAARGGLEYLQQGIIKPINEIRQWQPAPAMQTNPLPQRRYPWGKEIETGRANYDQTGIGDTSAMGCFPGGASPYGCLDMSGNVWGWTRSHYQDYPYDSKGGREDLEGEGAQVVRGGAFYFASQIVRCAIRNGINPNYRNWFQGFRICCVVSPFTSGL